MPSTARCLDAYAVAGLQRPRAFGRDALDAPVVADDHVAPGLPRRTARETVRRMLAPVREQRHARRDERFDLAHDATTAARAPSAAGVGPQRIRAHAQRVSILKRLDRRVQTVRHVCVYAAQAVNVWARAHAARDRLVVSELARALRLRAADGQIVHRALTRRRNLIGQ